MANPHKLVSSLKAFRIGSIFTRLDTFLQLILKVGFDTALSILVKNPKRREAVYDLIINPAYQIFFGLPLRWFVAPAANIVQNALLAPAFNYVIAPVFKWIWNKVLNKVTGKVSELVKPKWDKFLYIAERTYRLKLDEFKESLAEYITKPIKDKLSTNWEWVKSNFSDFTEPKLNEISVYTSPVTNRIYDATYGLVNRNTIKWAAGMTLTYYYGGYVASTVASTIWSNTPSIETCTNAMYEGYGYAYSKAKNWSSTAYEYVLAPSLEAFVDNAYPVGEYIWDKAVNNSFGLPFMTNFTWTTINSLWSFAFDFTVPALNTIVPPVANTVASHIIPGTYTGLLNLSAYPMAFGAFAFLSYGVAKEAHRQAYPLRKKLSLLNPFTDDNACTLRVNIPDQILLRDYNAGIDEVNDVTPAMKIDIENISDDCVTQTTKEIENITKKYGTTGLNHLPNLESIYKQLNKDIMDTSLAIYKARHNNDPASTRAKRVNDIKKLQRSLGNKVAATVNAALREEASHAPIRIVKNSFEPVKHAGSQAWSLAKYALTTAYNNPGKAFGAVVTAGAGYMGRKALGM